MKLILGTVQLGIDYGVNKKKPTFKQSLEILNYCIENNINTFDTAQDYGKCEEIISNITSKNVNIITKIDFNSEEKTYEEIFEKINISLKNLKLEKLYTLLLHNFNDFQNKKLVNNLFKIKEKGIIENLGVSVYNVEEAIDVIKDNRFKVIQIPFNYIDNQWNNEEFQQLIKKRVYDLEIHVRSIFLQGILINDFKYWPKIESYNFREIYDNINKICNKYNLTKIELVIGYIKSIKWINSILFGVDNIKQLEENIRLYNSTKELSKEAILECKKYFNDIPEKLINPVNWS